MRPYESFDYAQDAERAQASRSSAQKVHTHPFKQSAANITGDITVTDSEMMQSRCNYDAFGAFKRYLVLLPTLLAIGLIL